MSVANITDEVSVLSDNELAEVVVAVITEVGNRGRNAGIASVEAGKAEANSIDFMEGIAQLEPLFEE